MSYDYNALVESIATHRRKVAEDPATHLQQAVDAFATLSSHCPMTPLLWMQYAHDNSQLMQLLLEDEEQAAEMRLQTLELGISEFPGCAVLRLHYLQLLVENDDQKDKVDAACREAIASVGRGSHRNEGELVAAIYRLYATHLASQNHPVMDLFVQRAETPMKDANDGLMDEVHEFCQVHDISLTHEDFQRIEQARCWTAKTFNELAAYEDDVDVAMHAEGILTRHEYSHDVMDWTTLLRSESSSYWMGLGGAQTATAFAKYAQACSHYSVRRQDDDNEEEVKQTEQRVRSLALAVYERGVSECPTVESLWLSYLRHLMYLISTKHSLGPVSQLELVASRAVRNCPYSVQLFQQQIKASLASSDFGHTVFDPDTLTSIVDKAIESKFLPDPKSQLELYMAAIRTVKRRIMTILAQSIEKDNGDNVKYDGAEPNAKKNVEKKEELEEAVEQEVNDLIEDIRDMYEDADKFLRKNHESFSEGRTMLWKDRAMSETYLLGPLLASMDGNVSDSTGEGISCFEKMVKLHLPPHPDDYGIYIQAVMNQSVSSPTDVVRRLRTVRSLFQKALQSIGKPRDKPDSSVPQRDRTTALHSLCHHYLEFEALFGSDESYFHASKTVGQKLEKYVVNGTQQAEIASIAPTNASSTSERKEPATEASARWKRKHSEDDSAEPAAKKSKPSFPSQDIEKESTNKPKTTDKDATVAAANEKGKHPIHKIRIGKLDYPAHPFTVRVTNLAYETEDMDLVDAFRVKCGAVVHAKIVRDKHQYTQGKGKSKGWGLVQFEERESVEKALELNDVIGIHERVIKVERSHVPAAGLVPPGMHRVNPKGEGKSTKRNQKKKEQQMSKEATHEQDVSKNDEGVAAEDGDGKQEAPEHKPSNAGILAFRPRGVGSAHLQSKHHRKVHLSLGEKSSKG